MDVFTMVTIIVIVGVAGGLLSEYLKRRPGNDGTLADIEERVARLERVEERVRNLEAIVTDQSYQLNQEIKRL